MGMRISVTRSAVAVVAVVAIVVVSLVFLATVLFVDRDISGSINDSQTISIRHRTPTAPTTTAPTTTAPTTTTTAPTTTTTAAPSLPHLKDNQYVCIDRGRLVATKQTIRQNPFDYGGHHPYTIPVVEDIDSIPHIVWRPWLIASWFSCEGNLHHFLSETLHPVAYLSLSSTTTTTTPPPTPPSGARINESPLLAIVGEKYSPAGWGWVPTADAANGSSVKINQGNDCHSTLYAEMIPATEVNPTIYFQDYPHRTGYFYSIPTTGATTTTTTTTTQREWNKTTTYCFHKTMYAKPWTNSPKLDQNLLSWGGQNKVCSQQQQQQQQQQQKSNTDTQYHDDSTNTNTTVQQQSGGGGGGGEGVEVLIIDRRKTRRIRNVQEIAAAARTIPHVTNVTVVYLEELPLREQMALVVCGRVIFAGVQGAGLKWATFLKSVERTRRSALIEFVWDGWPSRYEKRVMSSHVQTYVQKIPSPLASCPPGYPDPTCCDKNRHDGACPYPTKDYDINVTVEEWKGRIENAASFICGVEGVC